MPFVHIILKQYLRRGNAPLSDIISPLWWGFLSFSYRAEQILSLFLVESKSIINPGNTHNNGSFESSFIKEERSRVEPSQADKDESSEREKNNNILFLSIVMMVLSLILSYVVRVVHVCLSIYCTKDKTDCQPYENWHIWTFLSPFLILWSLLYISCYSMYSVVVVLLILYNILEIQYIISNIFFWIWTGWII